MINVSNVITWEHRGLIYRDIHIKSKSVGEKIPSSQYNYKTTRNKRHKYIHRDIHINSKHVGVKIPCAQCDYITTWKDALLLHIKTTH